MRSPTNSLQYEGILIQRKSIFKTSKPQQYTIRFLLFSPHTPTHTLKTFPVIIFQPRVLVLFVRRLLLFPLHPPHLLPFLSSLSVSDNTLCSAHIISPLSVCQQTCTSLHLHLTEQFQWTRSIGVTSAECQPHNKCSQQYPTD